MTSPGSAARRSSKAAGDGLEVAFEVQGGDLALHRRERSEDKRERSDALVVDPCRAQREVDVASLVHAKDGVADRAMAKRGVEVARKAHGVAAFGNKGGVIGAFI